MRVVVLSVIQALILDCAPGAVPRRSVTVAYRAYHCTSVSTSNRARFSSANLTRSLNISRPQLFPRASTSSPPSESPPSLIGEKPRFSASAPISSAAASSSLQARGATASDFNRAVYERLKPGGSYVIVDHAAAAGAGTSNTQALHRIDPASVREEVEAAGFVLDAQSTMLANKDDPHSIKVFDPSIKGETDRFAYRFVKP